MPEIFKRDGAIWARSDGREVKLERAHQDRKKPSFWRAVGATGDPITPWLMNPKVAAIRGLQR